MLLFGVLIFSYIMNEYVALLDHWKLHKADYDEGDKLRMWFGTLKHFNKKEDIKYELKKKYEDFFIYSWANYKNLAFKQDEDLQLYEQLPDLVTNDIFFRFLYSPFLRVFNRYLSIPIPRSPQSNTFFTFDNPVYKDFIRDLVKELEPRFELKGVTILNELDEVTEVVMFTDGKIDVGYEINSKKYFVLRYQNSTSEHWNSKSYG